MVIAKELKSVSQSHMTSFSLKNVYSMFNMQSFIPWIVVVFGIISSSCIIVYAIIIPLAMWQSNLVVGILLLICLSCNIAVNVWIFIKKEKDVSNKIVALVNHLEEVQTNFTMEELIKEFQMCINKTVKESVMIYPSHNFSMLYFHTDGKAVPFPTVLLSTNHVIGLCSGQSSPCRVVCAQDSCITLELGETFYQEMLAECSVNRDLDKDLCKFQVEKSPIVVEIESCLLGSSKFNHGIFNRPKSMLTKNREQLTCFFIIFLIPITALLSFFIILTWNLSLSCASYFYDIKTTSLFPERNSAYYWYELFVISPVLCLLPIIPIFAPFLWVFLYLIGEAQTLAPCFKQTPKLDFQLKSGTLSPVSFSGDEISHAIPTKTNHLWLNLLIEQIRNKRSWFCVSNGTFDKLGSITALCCIDKEGILSWCDPTPEKVCFMNSPDLDAILDENEDISDQSSDESCIGNFYPVEKSSVNLEVLTLSQDAHNHLKLHFDDTGWYRHIQSLKPIGLSVIVGNQYWCNNLNISGDCHHAFLKKLLTNKKQENDIHKSFEQTLSKHRTELIYNSLKSNCFPPEVNSLESGLRSFAKLIGFDENISLLHHPKRLLTCFKKISGSISKKKSATSSKPPCDRPQSKPYMAYVHGVITTQWADSEQEYILTCGSGDIVLEMCSHYWDGVEIRLLESNHKKKLLDFCHRNSIAGICIMYAFRPVTTGSRIGESSIEVIDDISSSRFPSNQIFLGMITLQYQPRGNVFRIVEALDAASIRFVHFSTEDEFKARVFAEKMGLEAGWNCHISLASHTLTPNNARSTIVSVERLESDNQEEDSSFLVRKSSHTPVSESSFSDSAFYQQNRAKLPRGIENILPHIEDVDNVPLLVPLFTDCTQASMKQMISIMQKYDEVVCCVGSSESIDNIKVFAQADVSIGLRPMLSAHVTSDAPFNFLGSPRIGSSYIHSSAETYTSSEEGNLGDCRLMSLARTLTTFPCSATLNGDDSLGVIYHMIQQARHSLLLSTVSVVLLVDLQIMVTVIQLLSLLLHLPLIFTPLDITWLSLIINPLISLSMLASPRHAGMETWASLKTTSKKNKLWPLVKSNLKTFFIKFFPTCLVVVLIFLLCLFSTCDQLQQHAMTFNLTTNGSITNSSSIFCYPCFTVIVQGTEFRSLLQNTASNHRFFSQQLALSAYVIYISFISSGYVYRWKNLRHSLPFTNKVWRVVLVCCWLMQAIYSGVICSNFSSNESSLNLPFLHKSYKIAVLVLFLVWPTMLLFVNETFKYYEIKLWKRNQKRARLAFGTKLGMNSPF